MITSLFGDLNGPIMKPPMESVTKVPNCAGHLIPSLYEYYYQYIKH